MFENEITDKMLKIDELGEAPVLGENLEQDGATDDELANIKIEDESKALFDREQTTVDAGTHSKLRL